VLAAVVAALAAAGTAGVVLLAHPARPAAAEGSAGRLSLVGSNPLMNRGMNAALAMRGNYAYVGSRTDGTHPNAGVLTVDVSNPARPEVVDQIGQPDEANPGESSRELRVWAAGGLLVVMNFACDDVGHACAGSAAKDVEPRFSFYDIRGVNAARPKLVSTYTPSHNPHEFFLWQDPRRPERALLYISTPFTEGADIDKNGPHLIVTDISGARSGRFRELVRWTPQRERRYEAAGLHSLSVSPGGGRAYLADLEGGFAVADTTALASGAPGPRIRQLTPAARTVHHEVPGVHSALPLPGRPGLALIDDEVYGAGFGAGPFIGFNVLKGCPWGWARLVDASDPARPSIVSQLKVVPYNDPARCSEFSSTQQNGASFSSHNPTLTEHLAVLTWHSAGVRVASTADPRRPTPVAAFRPDPLTAVATEDPALSAGTEKVVMWSYPVIKDGLIYVVDIRNGLYVLRYRGPYGVELGCQSFLEGNSTVRSKLAGCGLRLGIRVKTRSRRTRARRRCRVFRLRAAVRGADVGRVRRVEFRVRGRRVAADASAPFSKRIPVRKLPRRRARLTALVTVDDGSEVPLRRKVSRCRR
jgi:LVIVD repeat-containing protein